MKWGWCPAVGLCGGSPREGRFPCMVQPLESRGFWPHGEPYSVLPLHPGWILEITGEALCSCDAVNVRLCHREVGSLLSITANINSECSRLKFPPLSCSGSTDHSDLTWALKVVFMCCCQGLVLVLCKEENVSSGQAAHGAMGHPNCSWRAVN